MTFTASNGIMVDSETQAITGNRRIKFCGIQESDTIELSGRNMRALFEALDHERDEELGRWRWPANQDWVAIEGDRNFDGDRTVIVVNERTFHRFHANERVRTTRDDGSEAHQAALAYFEAHPEPEPKPWHDAKPGEVWAISTENVDDEVAVRVAMLNERLTFEYVTSISTRIHADDERIVTGRRIWPEDES